MRTLYAKQVILQVAASLCKLEQLIVVEDCPVQMGHDGVGDVCSSPFQDVQDIKGGLFPSPRMDNQRSPCMIRVWKRHMQLVTRIYLFYSEPGLQL